ncbi:unnamed protein product, partial [Brassica oleracea var. botrytis]
GGCVTSSRSSNIPTHEQKGGEEESDTGDEQERWGGDGVKRQRRRLVSRLMLTALATYSEVTKPFFMKSESCEEDHRRQMSKPETIET